jgi:hypothetical protein
MIRMKSLKESPPHGWMVTSPLVGNPMRDWSFGTLCRRVHQEHPEWKIEEVERQVERANAERLSLQPDASRWVIVDQIVDMVPDLIAQANERTTRIAQNQNVLLVLPFCSKDVSLVRKVLDWMRELDPGFRPDILLTYDGSVGHGQVHPIKEMIMKMGSDWDELRYPIPPTGYFAPNWAFQCTARFISRTMKRPWLWFEADMVPVKSGWLEILQAEYVRARKPCMGVIVPGMGHMNGTAIYPANYPDLAKQAMVASAAAWDMVQKDDLPGLVHNAPHLMQHCWGIVNNRPHPSHGPPAIFASAKDLQWLAPGVATFHRCKDGTLIDRLRDRKP